MVPQGWKGLGGSGSMLEVWSCVGYVCGVGFSGVLPLGKPGSGELLLLQVTNTASDTSPSWPSRPPASQRLCFHALLPQITQVVVLPAVMHPHPAAKEEKGTLSC